MSKLALLGSSPAARQQRRPAAAQLPLQQQQQQQPLQQQRRQQRPRPQRRRGGTVLAAASEATAAEQQQQQQQQQGGPGSNGAEETSSSRRAAAGLETHGATVEVRDMVKHFETPRGLFKAVNGASVSIEPGTITALLGPSGSGKTTLLRLIAGLEEPTAGRVLFDGEDVTDKEVQDRDLGFVFQGYALFKHMTVADNITFGPRMRKMGIDLQARVDELLELTELTGLAGRFPPQLSGGQKQRVAMARAMACNPRLMLLDEPFGALDPIVRKSLRHGLREIVKRVGVTTIIVTHDQEEAWDIADQVVIFNKGAIEQTGTPEEVAQAPVSPFVMNFCSDVNHVPSNCQLVRKVGFHTDKPFVMCRPGDYVVSKDFGSSAPAAPATVHDKQDVGRLVHYYLRFDDDVDIDFPVSRRVDEESYDLDVGQRVLVSVDPQRMMAFSYDEIDATASVV